VYHAATPDVDDKYERLGIRVTSIGEVPYLDPAVEAEDKVEEATGIEEPNGIESNGVEPKGLKEKAAETLATNGIAVNGNGHPNGH
jgi:hypothetical protein